MSHNCADNGKRALVLGGSGLERLAIRDLVINAGLDASIIDEFEDTCSAVKNFDGNLIVIKVSNNAEALSDLIRIFVKVPTIPIVLITDSRLPESLAANIPDNLASIISSNTSVEKITMIIQLAADGMIIRKNNMRRSNDSAIVRSLPLKSPIGSMSEHTSLTTREAEVAAAVAIGSSNKEIARSLDIAVNTVNVHVNSLIKKLGVTNRTQIALWVASNNSPRPGNSALSA